MYAPHLIEGVNFVSCKLCEQSQHFRSKRLKQHLEGVHQTTVENYLGQFSGALVNLQSTTEKRKSTNKEVYGAESPISNTEVAARAKTRSLEKHGVEHASQAPEVIARRAQTNRMRYGVSNVFESDVFQQKAKDSLVAKYGVENAQQIQEVKQRTAATNLERYGAKVFCNSEVARTSNWWNARSEAKQEREADRRAQLLRGPHEICPHCDEIFAKITSRHKVSCEGWTRLEVEPCLCGHVASSLTSMKRDHRPHCQVWQTRDAEDVCRMRRAHTMQKRYGVSHVSQVPGVQDKIRATNIRKYGAPHRFSKGATTYEANRAWLKAHPHRWAKGTHPLSRPENQAKGRKTRLERYGVEHAGQIPGVMEKVRQTNQERYGADSPMQSKEVQDKVRATNQERYGHANAAASEEVKAKIRETNLARYGVGSTAAIPEFRRKQLETMEANWGSHFFASDKGKQRLMGGMRKKYGVDYFAQVEGFWKRQVKHFLAKYGVSHPLQLAEFLEKRAATCRRLYGVESPLQSPEIMAKVVATCLEKYDARSHIESKHAKQIFLDRYGVEQAGAAPEVRAKITATNLERFGVASALAAISVREKTLRTCLAKVGKLFPEFEPATTEVELIERYGVAYPQQDREYRFHFLTELGENFSQGPNGFEAKVLRLCGDLLMYTGDRKFWRWLPALGHHKNPDFIVPGPDPDHPRRDVAKVIECHGDFWHSERFTGMSNEEHERLLIDAYKEVGLECLIIWEADLRKDPEAVRQRVLRFVKSGTSP